MHEQVKRISVILNADLDDEDTCVSLQVAIMIYRLQNDIAG